MCLRKHTKKREVNSKSIPTVKGWAKRQTARRGREGGGKRNEQTELELDAAEKSQEPKTTPNVWESGRGSQEKGESAEE